MPTKRLALISTGIAKGICEFVDFHKTFDTVELTGKTLNECRIHHQFTFTKRPQQRSTFTPPEERSTWKRGQAKWHFVIKTSYHCLRRQVGGQVNQYQWRKNPSQVHGWYCTYLRQSGRSYDCDPVILWSLKINFEEKKIQSAKLNISGLWGKD